MMEAAENFSPGDLVRHKPTGENWVVKKCNGEQLEPTGWPKTIARKSDCEMLQAGKFAHWDEFKYDR